MKAKVDINILMGSRVEILGEETLSVTGFDTMQCAALKEQNFLFS